MQGLILRILLNYLQTYFEMISILTIIIDDLEIIVFIQESFFKRLSNEKNSPEKKIDPRNFQVVTFSYLILTLCKYMEFYEIYKSTINMLIPHRKAKNIYQEIRKSNIKDFRNRYIGHVINDKTKRPISSDEYENFFDQLRTKHGSSYNFYLKIFYNNFTDLPLLDSLKEFLKKIEEEFEWQYKVIDRILSK